MISRSVCFPGLTEHLSLMRYDNCLNLMKAAICCADRVSTVSPSYAEEIKTYEYSHGLDHILHMNSHRLCGIFNGIDYDYYNPAKDKVLAKNSGVKECYKIIETESDELIHVNPGDKILGARLIGLPPIPVGINEAEGTILITYTKPCHGTAAIELPVDKEELISIRKMDIGA